MAIISQKRQSGGLGEPQGGGGIQGDTRKSGMVGSKGRWAGNTKKREKWTRGEQATVGREHWAEGLADVVIESEGNGLKKGEPSVR